MLIAWNLGHRSQCSNVHTIGANHEGRFVASANLTEAELDRSIEAGFLVRDAALPKGMERHFMGLIQEGALACQMVVET